MSINLTHSELANWKKHITAYVVCNILYYRRLVDMDSFKIRPHSHIYLPILSGHSDHPHVVRSINYLQRFFYSLDNGFADSFSIQIFDRSQNGTTSNHLMQSYQFDFSCLTLKVNIKGQATRLISIAPEKPFGKNSQLGGIATTDRPLTDYLPTKLFKELSSIDPLPVSANLYYSFTIGYLDTDCPITGAFNQQNNRRIKEDDENNPTAMDRSNGHGIVHKRARVN